MPPSSAQVPSIQVIPARPDDAYVEPDEEWKNRLKKEIKDSLASMVKEAKDSRDNQLREAPVSPEDRERLTMEYKTAMNNIRQLAAEQFKIGHDRERQERRWALGIPMNPKWTEALKQEQQTIMDRIKQGGAGSTQPPAQEEKAAKAERDRERVTRPVVPVPPQPLAARRWSDAHSASSRDREEDFHSFRKAAGHGALRERPSLPDRVTPEATEESEDLFERFRRHTSEKSNTLDKWDPSPPLSETKTPDREPSQRSISEHYTARSPPNSIPASKSYNLGRRGSTSSLRSIGSATGIWPPATEPIPKRSDYDAIQEGGNDTEKGPMKESDKPSISPSKREEFGLHRSVSRSYAAPGERDDRAGLFTRKISPIPYPATSSTARPIVSKASFNEHRYERPKTHYLADRGQPSAPLEEEQQAKSQREQAQAQLENAWREAQRRKEANRIARDRQAERLEVEGGDYGTDKTDDENEEKERVRLEDEEKEQVQAEEAAKAREAERKERRRQFEEERQAKLQREQAQAQLEDARRRKAQRQEEVNRIASERQAEEDRVRNEHQEEFRRREEEIKRRSEERKRQDSIGAEGIWPGPSPSPSASRSPPQRNGSVNTPAGDRTSNGSSSAWSTLSSNWSSSTKATSASDTSASSNAVPNRATPVSTSKPRAGSVGSGNTFPFGTPPHPTPTPMSEADWQRRKAEQARKQQEQFRKEQERLEAERQAKAGGRQLTRDELIRLFENHEKLWANLPSSDAVWNDFPWPMIKKPSEPEEITLPAVRAYIESPYYPEKDKSKTVKDRVKDHIKRWHPDRFNTKLLTKVREEEKEKVKEGAGTVVRCLNELLAKTNGPLFD